MDSLLVSRTQDAPREPTRSLPELLWSPLTPLLAGFLGSSPGPRFRVAPVGAEFISAVT